MNKLFDPVVTSLKLVKFSKTNSENRSKTRRKSQERILIPKYEEDKQEELLPQPNDNEDVLEDSTSEPLEMSNLVLTDVHKKCLAIAKPFIASEELERHSSIQLSSYLFKMESSYDWDIEIGGGNFKGTNVSIFYDVPKGKHILF